MNVALACYSSTLDGDEGSDSSPGRFTLGLDPQIPTGYKARWTTRYPKFDTVQKALLSLPVQTATNNNFPSSK